MNAEQLIKSRFPKPYPLTWTETKDENGYLVPNCHDCIINQIIVASLEARPPYCDRGHFWVKCYLPGLDGADRFPRYYMNESVAKSETEAFLKWRIWHIRGDQHVKEKEGK